jgi:PAS domain S-box-containing protein
MQTLQKRFSIILGFALLLIVLVVCAVITSRQLDLQVQDRNKLEHSRHILLELTRTESLLKDAETGQRGFLYTGESKYLEPYQQALSELGPQLDALSKSVSDDPAQVANVSLLRDLSNKKMSELAETISLYKSSKPLEAKALVQTDLGLNTMNAIRKLVDQIEAEETSVAAARQAVFKKSRRETVSYIYATSVISAVGLILLAFYILRQVNLRERHATQMREREEWFRVTLTSLGDAVIATDEDGSVTFMNPVGERLTGWTLDLARGKSIDEVFPIFNEYTHKPVESPVRIVMEKGTVVGLANHTVLRSRNGSITPIEDSAAPIRDDRNRLIGVVLVFRDATQERKSQEILRKTEKLAAASRLAATFAHEINNPLEAVVNLVYIVKHMEGLPAAAVQPLEMAEHELERVSHITRQTLGFYRESNVRGPVQLPAIIENVVRLFSNKFRSRSIQLEREFGACPPVQGLTGELTQAISNLISNSADAVPICGTIRTRLNLVEDGKSRWAQLVIEDDGPGIPPDLKDRIFEPFFTTKTDVGTGLGLWVTQEIIDRHGGSIEVIPSTLGDTGAGAAFKVLLPCAPELD